MDKYVFKVNKKEATLMSIDAVLVYLLLTLNRYLPGE